MAVVGVDPEALDVSSGTIDWDCRACSFPPRMKNDDEINNIQKMKLPQRRSEDKSKSTRSNTPLHRDGGKSKSLRELC